jgi:hypothetical protein
MDFVDSVMLHISFLPSVTDNELIDMQRDSPEKKLSPWNIRI